MFFKDKKPLKLPLTSGNSDNWIKEISIVIKNKRLAKIIRAIFRTQQKQK